MSTETDRKEEEYKKKLHRKKVNKARVAFGANLRRTV